jgi:D-beta-D-heptose 7-phosphate kinase/D-beta-D-heptose 1-phosphate adenosyltransferase
VLVDPKGKDYSKYKGAALLTPNRREAAEACNLDDSSDVVDQAGTQLMNELDLDALLVTERRSRDDAFPKIAVTDKDAMPKLERSTMLQEQATP